MMSSKDLKVNKNDAPLSLLRGILQSKSVFAKASTDATPFIPASEMQGKAKAGFMLSEVMIALVIVTVLILPIFGVITDFLMLSSRYRDQKDRLIAMKNVMIEKIYKSKEDKKQTLRQAQGEREQKRIKGLRATLKFTRDVVKKAKPFDKLSKNQL